ncbi:protein of unknown function [Methylocaldum szegediense]|uniref:Uncharacterized protein n=1 Tax=Methylocaldum szegediense TaxID=73780 RepID=A0ABM9HXM8_9GAMM|nr:protein of unknown function [Methylocaldum szegediense]
MGTQLFCDAERPIDAVAVIMIWRGVFAWNRRCPDFHRSGLRDFANLRLYNVSMARASLIPLGNREGINRRVPRLGLGQTLPTGSG